MTINTPNRALELFADRVERLAFDMPAPNIYTPQFVLFAQAARACALLDAARAEGPVQGVPRDRAAAEPGGCECHRCGAIFVGAGWHYLCAVCAVTPPADEVGRAQSRLEAQLAACEATKAGHVFVAYVEDLRLLLSHVSRLEGALEVAKGQHACCVEGQNQTLADLKLAVEALESLTSAVEMQHGSMCPANTCTCDLNETLWLQGRSAREALRSIRSPIRGSDISSLRHEDMPLAPGGDVEASRQAGERT